MVSSEEDRKVRKKKKSKSKKKRPAPSPSPPPEPRSRSPSPAPPYNTNPTRNEKNPPSRSRSPSAGRGSNPERAGTSRKRAASPGLASASVNDPQRGKYRRDDLEHPSWDRAWRYEEHDDSRRRRTPSPVEERAKRFREKQKMRSQLDPLDMEADNRKKKTGSRGGDRRVSKSPSPDTTGPVKRKSQAFRKKEKDTVEEGKPKRMRHDSCSSDDEPLAPKEPNNLPHPNLSPPSVSGEPTENLPSPAPRNIEDKSDGELSDDKSPDRRSKSPEPTEKPALPKNDAAKSRQPREKSRSRSPERRTRRADHTTRDERRKSHSRSPMRRSPNRDRQDYNRAENRNRQRRDSRSPDRRRSPERKRSPERRKSPERRRSPQRTQRDDAAEDWFAKKRLNAAANVDPLKMRSGGAYIPPAKLKMLQEQIEDKSSEKYQRLSWEALKKRIHGKVNRINVSNASQIVVGLLQENIIRGKGVLARDLIQAQAFSPNYSHVYAALVASINSKFPAIGQLVLRRLVIAFKRSFRRNDKPTTLNACRFIGHLVNQDVAHELLALEMLTTLLENPTDASVEVACALLKENPTDASVEVACALLKEVGAKLTQVCSRGANLIFERLRTVLQESEIDKRVQYMIEVVLMVRRDKFKDHPAVIEELDLIEDEEDKITHEVNLDEVQDPESSLSTIIKHIAGPPCCDRRIGPDRGRGGQDHP